MPCDYVLWGSYTASMIGIADLPALQEGCAY